MNALLVVVILDTWWPAKREIPVVSRLTTKNARRVKPALGNFVLVLVVMLWKTVNAMDVNVCLLSARMYKYCIMYIEH